MSSLKTLITSIVVSVLLTLSLPQYGGDPGTSEPDPDPLQSPTTQVQPLAD